MLVYFDMPSNITINEKGAKTVLITGTGNKKVRIIVMLGVLANGCKLPPYVICGEKQCPKRSCQRA
jgi:hypothetical protein